MNTSSDGRNAPNSQIPSILVVDDDQATLAILSDYLKDSGFRVIVARDGEDALEQAQSAQPDLILLDVILPVMDGFETCRRLKANEALRDIPVIFMTALTDTANKVAGFRVGGSDYITKPLEREELMARIKTHLALHAAQEQLRAQNDYLEREISERMQAEEELRATRAELERRVEARTAELAQAVARLRTEITERKQAQERFQEYVRFLENLGQVERAIRQNQDLDKMILDILETVLSIFQSDRAWLLFPCDPDASYFRVPIIRTRAEYPVNLTPETEVPVAPDAADAFRTALSSKAPVTFDPQSGRLVPLGEEFSIRSQIILAIDPKLGKPWLFGMHQCSHARVWTEGEQRLFNEIGQRTADGLGSMLLLHELRKNEEKHRTSEQMLKSILSTSPVGIAHTVNRDIKWVNDAWLKMFGCETDEECVGQSSRMLYPSQDEFERVGKILYRRLETETVTETDAKFKRKDGSLFDGAIRIQPLNPSDLAKGTISAITDISERKAAEEALRLSEERYRLLVDKAPVGILSVDAEGRIIEVNEKLLQILGSPSADATKALNMLSFAPLVVSGISDVFSSCMGYGTQQSAEIPYTSKWGKTSYLRILVTPFLDESGTIGGCQAVMEDVSERKKAEEALRQSEERYRATFSNAAVGIDLVDSHGRFLDANDTLLKFLGYTRDELSNLTVFDVTHSADVAGTRARIHGLVTGEAEGYWVEKRYVRKDGSEVWADTSVSAIRDQAGQYVASVAVIADITGRKKAEEERVRLATAIEQAAEAILITDSEGTIAYVNPAFEKVTGYSRQEVIGDNPRILKSGQHGGEFYTHLWQTISTGQVWSGHMVNRRKDGTFFEEEATISPVKDDSGTIVNYVAVKRDVTKEVALQRQLLQAQKMEAIGTLAGGVAHDFNNLLQVVLGYADLLLMDKDEGNTEYGDLQRISQAARSGADLVQRLLTFSRKTEMKPRPLSLNHQIDRVREMISRTVPKMINIDVRLSDNLAKISADPTQMEQILMNLAVNAKDAMPEGGNLTIETRNVILDQEYCATHVGLKPGKFVLLSVADTGEGMDKETVDHIFEPFFTTKQPGQGTGLGLAVVYGIVEHHGGHITCYSEPGVGTAFKIHFPVLASELEPQEPSVKPEARGGSETILLVDDEEFIRDLGERILTKAGYTVLTAANGIEGLDLYAKHRDRISLIILDLIMPQMGGKQCLEELLRIDPEARVLIASGFAADGPTKETLQAGARGFVSKPYDVLQVLQMVRDTLDAE